MALPLEGPDMMSQRCPLRCLVLCCVRRGWVVVGSVGVVVSAAHPALAQSERAQQKRTSGFACQVIAGEEIQGSPTVALGLRARATGLYLRETSGQAGAGSQIALRGIGNMAFTSPMVFVDGLRIAPAPEAGQPVGILDQLNPNDVLLIEIFRGPAATALYGTNASGGVIRIYTKHGSPNVEILGDARAHCIP